MGLMKSLQSTTSRSKRKHVKGKPFGAIELATLNSDEWKKLTRLEAHLYNILKTFYKGERNNFKAPFSALKQRTRIKHGATLNKAIKGLAERGWIEVVRYAKHGRGRGLRVRSNEYKLTFTIDYCRW